MLLRSRRRAVVSIVEYLETRRLLSGSYDVNEVSDFALSQPLIYYYLKRPADTAPISVSDGLGGTSFTNQGYLDTGTSGVVLSQETAQGLGINDQTSNGQPVNFTDIGIGGGQVFGVSEPLDTGMAPYNPNTDIDNLSDYQTVFNQTYGPLRFETTRQPSADPFDPTDIIGMPVMMGKVVVMDPKPIYDPNLPQDMNTYIYNPGTPFNPSQATTNPGIPGTSLHVKLTFGNFAPYTTLSPPDAAGPTLAPNPMIGPNPLSALDPGIPPGNAPPLSFALGNYSGTGSFLFDTGAQASFMSQAEAAKLHVHYQQGTYGSSNPVLVDDNGNKIPNQTVLPLGGVGGTVNVAEFYIDSLTLQTAEGTPIAFHHVPIAVLDVGVTDPKTGKTLTLDGDFGANFLTASENSQTAPAFNWITFDQPDGLLGFAPNAALPTTPTVVGRYTFYNNSVFDGNDPAANSKDDAAIATDKAPLAEGDTATFSNYTSYSKGINGIMVDIAALPSGAQPSAKDFAFKVGNNNAPAGWATGPVPASVLVRPGAGTGGSTRIDITWADGAIKNEWLQITVDADATTGLSASDVFYFGNAIGESGNSASDAMVTPADEQAARSDPHSFFNPALITNPHDYNRDGKVDATDQIIARMNQTTSATALQLITTPLPAGAAALTSGSTPAAGTAAIFPALIPSPAISMNSAIPAMAQKHAVACTNRPRPHHNVQSKHHASKPVGKRLSGPRRHTPSPQSSSTPTGKSVLLARLLAASLVRR